MTTPTRRMRLDVCARAASGHVVAAPPMSVMKSRRLIGLPPAEDNNLPHHWGSAAALCVTAYVRVRLPTWVKSGRDTLKFRCPLYPRKRTFAHAIRMSALGRFCCRSPLQSFLVSDSVAVMRFATGAGHDGAADS